MDPGGSQSLGSPTKRQGAGGKEKQPKNKPARAEEENGRDQGEGAEALQSSGCLGSASSHCGHQRAAATVKQSTGRLPGCTTLPSHRRRVRPHRAMPLSAAPVGLLTLQEDPGQGRSTDWGRGGCSPSHGCQPQLPSPTLPDRDGWGRPDAMKEGQGPGGSRVTRRKQDALRDVPGSDRGEGPGWALKEEEVAPGPRRGTCPTRPLHTHPQSQRQV